MDARLRELGLEDNDEYPVWTLHPNRVFSRDCSECSDPNSPGCPTVEGRKVLQLFILRFNFVDTDNFTLLFVFLQIWLAILHNAAKSRGLHVRW